MAKMQTGAQAPAAGPAIPAASGVEVRPVRTRADLMRFIKLPFRLHRDQPNWVPPLISERKRHLSRSVNPFFEHGEAEYLLAWRGGRAVGRVSAHVDHRFNEFQDNDWGLFGFFECEDDREAAHALLDHAANWLRARGRDRIVGPLSFSTNHECGLLVDGFERKPMILEEWHPPHYRGLLESWGLAKAMDLLVWELRVAERNNVVEAIEQLAGEVESKHGVRMRHMRKRDFQREVRRFMEVYNEAWERNWGFVPLTDAELTHYAKELKPVLDEDWALIAEKGGETIGAALTLPDFNQVLAHLNGRLLPFGWAKVLWYRRRIDTFRVFALGVKQAHQHTGTAARFYTEYWDEAARHGWWGGEMGWILEANVPMNRAMEGMGGKVVKTYRIFDKPLMGEPAADEERPAQAEAAGG